MNVRIREISFFSFLCCDVLFFSLCSEMFGSFPNSVVQKQRLLRRKQRNLLQSQKRKSRLLLSRKRRKKKQVVNQKLKSRVMKCPSANAKGFKRKRSLAMPKRPQRSQKQSQRPKNSLLPGALPNSGEVLLKAEIYRRGQRVIVVLCIFTSYFRKLYSM